MVDIDYVVVNLYPFVDNVSDKTDMQEAVEYIDIGEVSLIRAAAKNFSSVEVKTNTDDYDEVATAIKEECFDVKMRMLLASKALSYVVSILYTAPAIFYLECLLDQSFQEILFSHFSYKSLI